MGCNASVGINDDCAGEINTNDRMRMLKDDGHIIPSSINLVTLFMGLVQVQETGLAGPSYVLKLDTISFKFSL